MASKTRVREVPQRLNLLLVTVLGGVQVAWLYGVWPNLMAPLALLQTTAYWALIHEAIHGGLVRNARWNLRLGRLLAIGHGAPFTLLRMGHLLHHRYSRTLDVSEAYDPAHLSRWKAALRHYGMICGGLYLGEVLAGWLTWLPRRHYRKVISGVLADDAMTRRFLQDLERPDALRTARIDSLLATGGYCLAFLAWGEAGWWLLFTVLMRGAVVSFFDNAYHYATPLGGDPADARNHYLPKWAGYIVLNFHWHALHHRVPSASWLDLPDIAERLGELPSKQGYVSGACLQWHGPISLDSLPSGRGKKASRNASSGALMDTTDEGLRA